MDHLTQDWLPHWSSHAFPDFQIRVFITLIWRRHNAGVPNPPSVDRYLSMAIGNQVVQAADKCMKLHLCMSGIRAPNHPLPLPPLPANATAGPWSQKYWGPLPDSDLRVWIFCLKNAPESEPSFLWHLIINLSGCISKCKEKIIFNSLCFNYQSYEKC